MMDNFENSRNDNTFKPYTELTERITQIILDIKDISVKLQSVDKKSDQYETRIQDLEKKIALLEQNLENTESSIYSKLQEIKVSLEKLENNYNDLVKNLSSTIRDEIKYHLQNMDTYNKENFSRLSDEIDDVRGDIKKIMFSILGLVATIVINIILVMFQHMVK